MEELNYLDIIYDSLRITLIDITPILLVFAFFQWGLFVRDCRIGKKC